MKNNCQYMFEGRGSAAVCLNDLDSPYPVDIEFRMDGKNYIRINGITVEEAEKMGKMLLSVKEELLKNRTEKGK